MITCNFENGDKIHLRHIVANTIVLKEDKILLGKRGTYKGKAILESGKWGLIGGFMGRGETLKEAIVREVMEESGWKVDNLILFRINDSPKRPKEDRQNLDVIFLATAIEKLKESDEEVTELKWFSLDKLPKPNQIAFDHLDSIEMYKKYLKEKFTLPILGEEIITK